MEHRHDDDGLLGWLEIDRVRKGVQEGPSNTRKDLRELEWRLSCSLEHEFDVQQKPRTQARLLGLVPTRSFVDVSLCMRPNDKPRCHLLATA